jgi:hypothetical protein
MNERGMTGPDEAIDSRGTLHHAVEYGEKGSPRIVFNVPLIEATDQLFGLEITRLGEGKHPDGIVKRKSDEGGQGSVPITSRE